MKLFIAVLFFAFLFAPKSAKAEIDEIINPSWQEIPDTAQTGELHNNPAYVNVNRTSKDEDMSIYDIVEPDAAYTRIQVNCKTNQFRAIRVGFFESRTRVNYKSADGPLRYPIDSYKQALLRFVCTL